MISNGITNMNVLLDPNFAYLLLVSGLFLAFLALLAPGTGLLELGALLMLVVAGYSLFNLQIVLWPLGVLLLGMVAMLIALRLSRQKIVLQYVFLVLAIAAMVVGSVFLLRQPDGTIAVNPVLAVVVSVIVVGLLWVIGTRSIEAINRPVSTNLERLVGKVGQARTRIYTEGSVYVGGEVWTARSPVEIPAGSKVRVVSREGLVLTVEPASPSPAKE
jgi:membrane-bound ClpP family serine protease